MFSSSRNRQDEGAGPGVPLAGLLMHSEAPSRDFLHFLQMGHVSGFLFAGMAGQSQLHRQQEEISSFGVV